MRAFHARPFTCRPSDDKNGFFSANPKRKVLRQAHFSDGCASIRVPFPCPFFPAGCGRKRDTETALGVYRPHRQRVPTGNRMTLVVLGFSVPPRLAAVWWISLLASHLRLKNLLSAWPPFLIPEIGAAPCRPDVDVSLMCLAMKNRPAVVT